MIYEMLWLFQGRNVVVFYGSQTGTSEEFAGRLAKDATRFGMKGMVADPEECEMVSAHHMALMCYLDENILFDIFLAITKICICKNRYLLLSL